MVSARYCSVHKNVLQLLLDCGALPEEELIENVIGCVEAHSQEAQAHKLKVPPTEEARQVFMRKIVLEEISPELERLGMKVAMKRHKGVPYFGLVNLREDEQQVASDLGKAQKEYFHLLLSAIQSTEKQSLDAADAGNLRLDLKGGKLSIDEVEECLAHLDAGGWLCKADDLYSLGIRSELQLMYSTQKSAEV